MDTQRRHFVLIDPGFQLRYALLLGAAGIFSSALTAGVLFAINRTARSELPLPPAVVRELALFDPTLAWGALAVTSISLVATGAICWIAARWLFTREALLIKS